MNKNIHNKIEQALNSLDGLQRAEASPYLYSKIRNRIQEMQNVIPVRIAWRMVGALVVVAVMNVFTIRHFQTEQKDTGAETVANEYSITLPQTY